MEKSVRQEPVKGKIISFRIADEEYLKIETLAKNSGFASVSYFAREATLKSTAFEPLRTPLDVQLERLRHRIEALNSSIERIIAQLNSRLNPEEIVG